MGWGYMWVNTIKNNSFFEEKMVLSRFLDLAVAHFWEALSRKCAILNLYLDSSKEILKVKQKIST